MARFPDWYSRLDSILETASPLETLGRREIQTLFACSERDSLRLLNQFGATKQKDALRITPSQVRAHLEALRDSPTFRQYRQQTGQVTAFVAVEKNRPRKLASAGLPAPSTAWGES
jgi:DNA-binding MarR family transcriptional regulator